MLKSRPEPEAVVILQRLRNGDDVGSLVSLIKAGDLMTELKTSKNSSPNSELSQPLQSMLNLHHPNAYPPLPPLGDPRAELGQREKNIFRVSPDDEELLSREDIENARSLEQPRAVFDDRLKRVVAARWTKVTENDNVVINLISLYLSWDHTTLRTLDEDYFLDDLSAGGSEYCSPLLVNAMLCAASLNYATIDPATSRRLGPRFFAEAEKLWAAEKTQSSTLMQVPAAIFLSMWCRSSGLEELSTGFISEAVRLAEELGLFDMESQEIDQREPHLHRIWRGRAVIAWGLFNWQTIHGFYLNMAPRIRNPPHFALGPEFRGEGRQQYPWNPFPLIRPYQIFYKDLIFKAYSDLFALLFEYLRVHDASNPTAERALEYQHTSLLHVKMLEWADDLPVELLRGPESLPMVIDLHMFYHGIIIGIYRPFTEAQCLMKRLARETMQASSSQLMRLLYIQRYRFDGPPFTSMTIGSVHILTFSLFEELAKAEDVGPETSFYLVLCAEAMKQYGDAYAAVHKLLYDLIGKAKRGGRTIPEGIDLIFKDLETRLSRRDIDGDAYKKCPIDIQIAITDPSGSRVQDMVKATYSLDADGMQGIRLEDGE
ncbi:uncharacterized protein JN550_004484 [Neoarthrinium moseri]|uniref:uncharacterized protein n=1 Tax=Neoarthrinium moseri TaxID=1658444 RepID=UPI001FDEA1DD|nr:uncharacterized protein JN550_004484 [Neoarthrinium moseri]KAI1871490.1 hypothetical protein JN550_004484 [Neoarthrinium moseri]